jgi:hypothetical protein
MNRIRLDSLTGKVQAARERLSSPRPADAPLSGWAARRGEQLYVGTFDVIGNFPGFEGSAGLIVNAQIDVTSRYLLVDEGEPHGFALGISEMVDASADPDPETFGDVLIRFRDDRAQVLFRLRPSRSRLPIKAKSRPEELVAALSDGGVEQADLARDVASTLRLSWDSLQSLETEAVVWRGQATAPLRPGLECAPASVWVTPNALLWGSPKGKGVNRLPINTVSRFATFVLNDDPGSPTVYVRTRVISDIRLDLPFIFNLGPPREGITARGSFLALFRPEAIVEGGISPRSQPWLVPPAEPDGEGAEAADEVDSSAESESVEAEEAGEENDAKVEVEAEPEFETWANVQKPSRYPYVPPGDGAAHASRRLDGDLGALDRFDSSGTRLADAISSWPSATSEIEEVVEEVPTATQPDALPKYVSAARRTIDEVNDAIDRRLAGNAAPLLRATPPSADDQARALSELIELTGNDYYSLEQSKAVKARATRIGEAAVRLRSLIELCNAGHMTIQEVTQKRDAIVANLPAEAEGI